MHTALWDKLKNFQVSQGDEQLTFVGRLARENGWSASHAERIYQEYLRFLYLAVVAGHPVTPSQDVDEAWHLHLCYSRSYWSDLCGAILKRDLHHGPTKGGKAERSKYREQYQTTLDSYRACFGVEPPQDIWPDVDARFHPRNQFVRVNRNDSFVLSKKVVYSLGAVVLGSFLLSSCGGFLEEALNGNVVNIVIIVIGVYLLVKLVLWLIRQGGNGGGCGTGCGGGFFGCGGSSGGDSGCGGGGGCGGGCGGGGD
jgi:hypothetical protein